MSGAGRSGAGRSGARIRDRGHRDHRRVSRRGHRDGAERPAGGGHRRDPGPGRELRRGAWMRGRAQPGCLAEPLRRRHGVGVRTSGRHADVGIAAARAGKNLLIEKPIDVSLAAADRLIEAAEAAGVTVSVVSQHRFDPGLAELRRLIRAGALGRLLLGQASTKWYRGQDYYDSAGWRGTWAMDGGALMNQGIHYADLLAWCMGPVAEVNAVTATQAHAMEAEDCALAIVRFGSGAVGSITASTAVFPGFAQRLEISGTEGTVIIEDGAIIYRGFRGELRDRDGPAARRTGVTIPAVAASAAGLDAAGTPRRSLTCSRPWTRAANPGDRRRRTGHTRARLRGLRVGTGGPACHSPGTAAPTGTRARDDHGPQRLRGRDFARPRRAAHGAGGAFDHPSGTAQRLVGQRGGPR